jgi:uncharacterized membrane protein (DUF373 family)
MTGLELTLATTIVVVAGLLWVYGWIIDSRPAQSIGLLGMAILIGAIGVWLLLEPMSLTIDGRWL